jgi:DNA polymerase III alpha subunit
MRIGLMQVKGLRLETIEKIVGSREQHGLYRSLENFLARVPVERDEIESLIKCGAMDDFGSACSGRPALLWRLNLQRSLRPPPAPVAHAEMLFPEALPPALFEPPATPAADYTREQRLAYEQEILEVCVSGHPLDLVARNTEVWSDTLGARRGKRVTLLGWLVTFRHVGTKDYRNMMFVTLEDQRGLYEAVLFPGAYERYGGLVFETRLLRVTGRVERDGQINCEKLEAVRK